MTIYYSVQGKLALSGGKAICSYIPTPPLYLTMFISSGSEYNILIKNGQAWGWGYNTQGQIGDNTVTSRRTPVSILGTIKTFCKIGTGVATSIVIDKNGQIWGWGFNYYGNIGDNTTTQRNTPVSILGAKKTFCSIDSSQHTIGIDKNGLVWGWGYNGYGQLGNNSVTNKITPVSILGVKKTFCSITTGQNHTMGIDNTGLVWGWGWNGYGQLGDNSKISKRTPVSILGAKKTFCSVVSGYGHSLGIDNTGLVWGWGYNGKGQLGDNSTVSKCTPVSILGAKKTFCVITSGDVHTIGIDKNGQVWCWGSNVNGQLGDNTIVQRNTPVSILGSKKTFCKISGQQHTLAIDKNGQLWSWGNNNKGELGDNTINKKCTPIRVYNL